MTRPGRFNPADPVATGFVWCPGCSVGMSAPGLPATCPHCAGELVRARWYPALGPGPDDPGRSVPTDLEGDLGAAELVDRSAGPGSGAAVCLVCGVSGCVRVGPGPVVVLYVGDEVIAAGDRVTVTRAGGAAGFDAVYRRATVLELELDGRVGRVLEVEVIEPRTGAVRSVRVERLRKGKG